MAPEWYTLLLNQGQHIFCYRIRAVLSKSLLFYHPSCNDGGCFFAMWWYKKDSGIRKWVELFIESFMELYELNHESVIRAGYSPLLFYELLCLLIIKAKFEYNISNNDSDWSRDTLNTVNKNICLVLLAVNNKINSNVEQAFDILVLRIFEEKGEIIYSFVLKPILAIISSTVHYRFYLIFLKHLPWFGNSLTRNIHTFCYLAALTFKFLHL